LISKDNYGEGRLCENFSENKMALVGHMNEDINNKNKQGLFIRHSINN
jgi:hypothetical protein